MKYIKPDTISIEVTFEEAKILRTVFTVISDDDPYGAASRILKADINDIVATGRAFENLLYKAIGE